MTVKSVNILFVFKMIVIYQFKSTVNGVQFIHMVLDTHQIATRFSQTFLLTF